MHDARVFFSASDQHFNSAVNNFFQVFLKTKRDDYFFVACVFPKNNLQAAACFKFLVPAQITNKPVKKKKRCCVLKSVERFIFQITGKKYVEQLK